MRSHVKKQREKHFMQREQQMQMPYWGIDLDETEKMGVREVGSDTR